MTPDYDILIPVAVVGAALLAIAVYGLTGHSLAIFAPPTPTLVWGLMG